MFNTVGPRYAKRRVLLGVVHFILLYGSEVWADQLRYKRFKQKLSSVQKRAALRVACSYRTVSEAAILILARATLIDLMAQERKRLHHHRQAGTLNSDMVKAEKAHTLKEWAQRWRCAEQGRWTARLISNLEEWLKCNHGELNYYLTQFLTGHGQFE